MQRFAITCDDENGAVLSNKSELSTWQALEGLVGIFKEKSLVGSFDAFIAMKISGHAASARETYAWREVLEAIKNNDLKELCAGFKDQMIQSLIMDRPVMLKIAGEVTNALMHSYNLKHKITFSQISPNDPS